MAMCVRPQWRRKVGELRCAPTEAAAVTVTLPEPSVMCRWRQRVSMRRFEIRPHHPTIAACSPPHAAAQPPPRG
jgi:hypothetical protein